MQKQVSQTLVVVCGTFVMLHKQQMCGLENYMNCQKGDKKWKGIDREKMMNRGVKQENYRSILSEIQNCVRAAQKGAGDPLCHYLAIGELVLLTEKCQLVPNDPVAQVGKDLEQHIGTTECFSTENLKKMKNLFVTYRVLIQIARDLKISNAKENMMQGDLR